jgi:cytochrome P450
VSVSESGLTSGIDVFEKGLETQQPELLHAMETQPIVRHDTTVTLMRMADIADVTHRPEVRSTPGAADAYLGAPEALIPLQIDGEAHRNYRRLLDPLFAPRAVARLEEHVRRLADGLIDGFVEKGSVEFYEEFCVPLPCTIFLELLGLPFDDLEFLLWFKDGVIRPTDDQHRADASARMVEYLFRVLEEREAEANPRDDLIGGFMAAEIDGQRLSREEVMNIIFVLVFAGLDTVTASLSCFVAWFARHAPERRRVIDDPALLPQAIEELLRYESPVPAIGRFAVADFEVGGEQIHAGDSLQLLLCTANLDPAAIPEPLTVDFDRGTKNHIDFGTGVHRCLGSHLARMELRVALEALHERIRDYAIDPERPPVFHNDGGVRTVEPLHLVFTPNPA